MLCSIKLAVHLFPFSSVYFPITNRFLINSLTPRHLLYVLGQVVMTMCFSLLFVFVHGRGYICGGIRFYRLVLSVELCYIFGYFYYSFFVLYSYYKLLNAIDPHSTKFIIVIINWIKRIYNLKMQYPLVDVFRDSMFYFIATTYRVLALQIYKSLTVCFNFSDILHHKMTNTCHLNCFSHL